MSAIECIGEGWRPLAGRLDRAGALARWAAAEPALARVATVAELRGVVQQGRDPAGADALLGALVRVAAADGGDEQDALLVVLHLLVPGARRLAARLADLSPDIDALVVGELAAQVRGFPWRRRRRGYAASLLLDARKQLLRDLAPLRVGDARVVLVDHGSLLLRAGERRYGQPGEVDWRAGLAELALLGDVLAWALDRGWVSAGEVELLAEAAGARRGDHVGLASRREVCERTWRRRRARAQRALRDAHRAYVAEQASAGWSPGGGRPAGPPECWPVSVYAA
jgi:hypothetical protein